MDIIEQDSALHISRQRYQPKIPSMFRTHLQYMGFAERAPADEDKDIASHFPRSVGRPLLECARAQKNTLDKARTVGVVLSGGQAPGGHTVICGLYDALRAGNEDSRVLGFLGGPSGLLERRYRDLESDIIDRYRHSGGFDMIGSGRTKLENEEQFARVLSVSRDLSLDAIVVIGGDDSNTNAALMAEYFLRHRSDTVIVGVPKTIDGDLRNRHIPISFGFDTATKTYSELIGNVCRDAKSAKKYWHFIKLMGRSASHIALECALQTHPNICIISEEVAARTISLNTLIEEMTTAIIHRANAGSNFGVALIPEGLVEFIPDVGQLIAHLNDLLATEDAYYNSLRTFEEQSEFINRSLNVESSYVFSSLPTTIQRQLLLDRDPHGNVQVSRIDTEQLLIEMIHDALRKRPEHEREKTHFNTHHHFFGYEGRCAFPTNFDTDYCYALGYSAALLIAAGHSGYMATVHNVTASSPEQWNAGAIPITTMMNMEKRHGINKPVIHKGLVNVQSPAFRYFCSQRDRWLVEDAYRYPGPIQYSGDRQLTDAPPLSLQLDYGSA